MGLDLSPSRHVLLLSIVGGGHPPLVPECPQEPKGPRASLGSTDLDDGPPSTFGAFRFWGSWDGGNLLPDADLCHWLEECHLVADHTIGALSQAIGYVAYLRDALAWSRSREE